MWTECIYFEHKAGNKWTLSKITDILGDYTHVVQAQNGTQILQKSCEHYMSPYKSGIINQSIRPTIIRDRSPIRTQITRQPEVVKPSTAYLNTSVNYEYNDSGQTCENQSNNSEMEMLVVIN
jgi:hypothetical protein